MNSILPCVEHFESSDEKNDPGVSLKNFILYSSITLAIVVVISAIIFGVLYALKYPVFAGLCLSTNAYNILIVVSIILEIVGITLTVSGVGIGYPIIGLGMFMEIIINYCDFLNKGPGWKWDLVSGIIGLIPLVGISGNIGKVVRLIQKVKS